jgi:HlyD family secretion protein
MSLKNSNAEGHASNPTRHLSGAAMDAQIILRRRPKWVILAAAMILLVLLAYAWWRWVPRGLVVPASDVTVATVERGLFRDDVIVRAVAQSLNSTVLDAVERGRVEVVMVQDGSMVKQGELLFRLSNPQRRMDLLQRQSERAQQLSNLSNFYVSFEAARNESKRRIEQLEFALRDAEKADERNGKLASQGFVSKVTNQDSSDRLERARQDLSYEQLRVAQEVETRRNAIAKLESAVADMSQGLQLFNESIDALTVRAPAAGRLTDFTLRVGEAVKVDQRVGRIDDPDAFKLLVQMDQFYLPRVAIGLHGKALIGAVNYLASVSKVYPQVTDGRFSVELVFDKGMPPGLRPGQAVDLSITLGEPASGLLLPNGAYFNDGGGAWMFVLGADGIHAERRAVRVGRRSNAQVEVVSGVSSGERVIVSSYAAFGKAERLQLSR